MFSKKFVEFFGYASLRSKYYTSNGMAAGNSYIEAVIQACSEIFERYSLKRIVEDHITPPDVDYEFLKNVSPQACDLINQIQSKGSYIVKIKDCSLGIGLPVVGICIYNKDSHRCVMNFGAFPDLRIALERIFTEVFQGKALDEGWLEFKGENVPSKHEYQRLIVNYIGLFPDEFHGCVDSSYNLDEQMFNRRFSSNTEMLDFCKEQCRKLGSDIFVKDTGYLGFPAVHVIVPGISEINDCNKTELRLRQIQKKFYYTANAGDFTSLVHVPSS